jgi:hypothetical protein
MSDTTTQAGKIEWLKVDDLQRDTDINVRPLDEKRASRYASDFDIDALGVIEVSRRPKGENIILDGQHRVEALRIMGWNGEKIPCKVFCNLTRAQEAKKFILLNTQVAIRYLDKFLSRITAKDKVACAIAEIVRANGYVIDRQTRDGVIVAAKALEDIYLGRNQKIRGTNPKALHGTLHAVTEAWGRTIHSVNVSVISGVGAFLLRYGDDVKLDRLIEKLRGVAGGPQGLINRGRGKREIHGGSLAMGIGHYLTDVYNSGLRGSSRLPDWRE